MYVCIIYINVISLMIYGDFIKKVLYPVLKETGRVKLYAERVKLYAGRVKLYAKCVKLYGRRVKLYAECVKLYGRCVKLYADCVKLYGRCVKLYADCVRIRISSMRGTPAAFQQFNF
jgi:hypothetical protein